VHINVTAHPYAEWAAQQIVEAVGFDTSIARLIRDRDRIYGHPRVTALTAFGRTRGPRFDARVNNLGIQQFPIAPRAPWQNGCAERFVGTLRRELLDHVIVLSERHLLRLVQEHMRYYNEDRPHMTLDGDAPVSRAVQRPGSGRVVALSRIGGLHHRYARAA
jgi:transposase InsO family protein